MSKLSIKNLDLYYGDFKALKNVNLEIEANKITAFIGPSGCGKSTLLKSINRMNDLVEGCRINGEILLDGQNIFKGMDVNLLRKRVGMVFQKFNLFPLKTVVQNVMMAPILTKHMNKEVAHAKALELLDKVGLKDKADVYPSTLSGGQQQRVAIARALALHPQILFFDEPTSALDPELTGEILKVIRQLASEHMTMVIVTHEMAFARDVADRVIFMDGGYIIEQGDPKEVIEHPKEERTKQFLARFAQN